MGAVLFDRDELTMGQLKTVLESFTGDDLAEAREHVRTLFELGNAKGQIFERDIKAALNVAQHEGRDNQTVPIESVVDARTEVHAYTSTVTNAAIVDTVQKALKQFVTGGSDNIISVISNLMGESLSAFLGGSEARSAEKSKYVVMVDGMSIIRLDVRMWYTEVSSSIIQRRIEKIVVVSALKSTVDIRRININTLLALYVNQLSTAGGSPDSIHKEVDEMRFLFQKLN